MQLTIDRVVSLSVKASKKLSAEGEAFWVRHVVSVNDKGERFDVVYFAKDGKSLITNLDDDLQIINGACRTAELACVGEEQDPFA